MLDYVHHYQKAMYAEETFGDKSEDLALS